MRGTDKAETPLVVSSWLEAVAGELEAELLAAEEPDDTAAEEAAPLAEGAELWLATAAEDEAGAAVEAAVVAGALLLETEVLEP